MTCAQPNVVNKYRSAKPLFREEVVSSLFNNKWRFYSSV